MIQTPSKLSSYALTLLLLLGSLLPSSSLVAEPLSDAKKLASYNTEQRIVYKTVDGRKLDLVLFLPKNPPKEKMPVMLYTHGGGWRGGNIYKIFRPAFVGTLDQMLDAGIACAAVKYRRTIGDITAVDSVQDCKDAARFLVKNADTYNLDPGRMGVWGGSAGGHLSLMTGLAANQLFAGSGELESIDPKFSCIVAYYPLTSFLHPELLIGSNFEAPETMIPMLGGLATEKPQVAALLSPVEHVKKNSPPVLLIHGEKDRILPISQSEHFLKTAKENGATASILPVKGAKHSFGGKNISPTMEAINETAVQFIIEHLKN
ncbi:MAG: prolyl oligopeptidase family serine peptidase [Opitutaceae bacterium]